jgi:hypothetical protein
MSRQRLHHDGERLWLAGAFAGIDGVASQSVVAHDGTAWHAVDDAGLGVVGSATRLASGGESCETFALVGASHVGGAPFDGSIARFTGDAWEAAAPSLDGRYCPDFAVRASGEIVVGCAGGELLHLEDGAWAAIDTLPGTPQELVVDADDVVWIAGGDGTGYLARYETGAPTIVEDGFDGLVLRMAVAPSGDVVVGGAFTQVGETTAARIARWDGSEWSALGDGLVSTPSAIAATATDVYAGSWDEGVPDRMVLGRWDGAQWTELATPDNGLAAPFGESSHTFTSLAVVDEGIVAVGYVWPESGGRNAYLLDDEGFHDLAGGIAAITVDDVLVQNDAVWFAGSITEVGAGDDLRSSIGVARLGW